MWFIVVARTSPSVKHWSNTSMTLIQWDLHDGLLRMTRQTSTLATFCVCGIYDGVVVH